MNEASFDNQNARIVIVGGGHAGGSIAAQLRHFGHTGDMVLIGEEAIVPYQRPPLSKAFLKGETDAEALKLKPDEFYEHHKVALCLGARVTRIDRTAKRVDLDGRESFAYDILILATGARARKLTIAGSHLERLYELRSINDAEALKAVLQPGKRLAIVGGGYIGLEAAASARSFGAEAIVIEREHRVLARVTCEELSGFFERYHRERGVEIIENAAVSGFEGAADGFVSAVTLADGGRILCDAALIGVGAMPNVELAQEAGLDCDNGIIVDLEARTSDPSIFAIGDVTNRPMPLYERRHRLESVPNALEQAKQASAAICGRPAPNPEVPWFWSDQYDLKLQIAGIPFDADRRIVRGSIEKAKFAVFHLKEDRILAVEAINSAPEFLNGRQLIGNRKPVSLTKLADVTVPMKEVAA